MGIKLKKPLHFTHYIALDTEKCTGCFQCVEVCQRNVIGKIKFLWHKHALILHGNDCIGCYKCVGVCKYKAITKTS